METLPDALAEHEIPYRVQRGIDVEREPAKEESRRHSPDGRRDKNSGYGAHAQWRRTQQEDADHDETVTGGAT